MNRLLIPALLILIGVALTGCNLLLAPASASSGSIANASSGSLPGASSGDSNLLAYRQAHRRATASARQANPNNRPRTIQAHRNYPFNNAIPFYRRGVGTTVTSGFGWRDLWGKADFHCGVDVQARAGTAVLAVTGGHVTFTRSAGRNGGVVIYDRGRQYTYWHVEPARNLREGQRVRKGQRIGTLANWGGNTHLHYALYLTGNDDSPNARKTTNCVDPMGLARQGLF